MCCWSSTDLLNFPTPLVLKRITKPSHRSPKCMVFILGASSLDHALRKLPAPSQKRDKDTCFTKPGLSLNFNARDSQKTIQYYLHHYLSHRNDLVTWHDAINNSISRHRSNNNRKLSSEQLVNLLLRYRTNLCAIVYCRRKGTEDIEESLGSTGILVHNVVKDFNLSVRLRTRYYLRSTKSFTSLLPLS